MKRFFVLNKKGKLSFKEGNENQCKEIGILEFEYTVRLTVKGIQLDTRGFIIDHSEIHHCIVSYFKRLKVTSCERTCKSIGMIIEKLCQVRNIKPYELHVSIKPVVEASETPAFIEHLIKY